jgi:hypothetical protein
MRVWHVIAIAALLSRTVPAAYDQASQAGGLKADEDQIRALIAKPSTEIPRTADSVFWSGPLPRPVVGNASAGPNAEFDKRVAGSFKSKVDVRRLVVAKSGDLAYEFSNFSAEYLLKDRPTEPQIFTGSLLRVWKKEDGQWKEAARFQRPHDGK